ncbi:MAG TPA: prepilin-type N-terminal cleavage/methylation domain-containing protein [Gemmatimonadales bacterium]|jgi:prepilin-type N-terminal cleavage/methylation domain-containing protein|nr:prepilin-type N-terminal cleavage/methylation domain-containing protein [Gemmatimonadales bacterium]
MRRGLTLVELAVTLVIIGLLAGVLVPGAGAHADRLAVEHEAARLLTAYRAAWLTATVRQRLALLRVTPDSLAIHTVSGAGAADTALAWLAPGPLAAGVSLRSPPETAVFGPDGIAMGLTNGRHILVRGRAVREVVISRLGRVRIQP